MNPSISVFLIFLTSLFTQLNSVAQLNLVPNPSFEIRDSCPDFVNQVHHAIGWKALLLSPDYFHVCATNSNVSIPQNLGGYQFTSNTMDSAYVGVGTSHLHLRDSVREIIGITMLQPLIIGQKYYVSFLISAGSSPNSSPCYNDRFGIKLITYLNTLTTSNKSLVDNISQFYIDSIISDTTNWSYIRGSFIADSAYTDILIGNFFTLDSLNTSCVYPSTSPRSYYYLDRICLSTDSSLCELASEVPVILRPSAISVVNRENDLLILLDQNVDRKMSVFDMAGRLIVSKELNIGFNSIDKAILSSGMYIIWIDNYAYKFIN